MYNETVMRQFTAALHTTGKNQEQPTCPSVQEQIKKNVVYSFNQTHTAVKTTNDSEKQKYRRTLAI